MQPPFLSLFLIIVIAAVALFGKPVLAALLGIPAATLVAKFEKNHLREDK